MSVSKKPKKRSVKKDNDNIEVSMGGAISKYEIMTAIAKKYTIYEATVWLNEPVEKYENKTPAELMIEGELKTVQKLIEDQDDQSSS
jgi:hypothetical protein